MIEKNLVSGSKPKYLVRANSSNHRNEQHFCSAHAWRDIMTAASFCGTKLLTSMNTFGHWYCESKKGGTSCKNTNLGHRFLKQAVAYNDQFHQILRIPKLLTS